MFSTNANIESSVFDPYVAKNPLNSVIDFSFFIIQNTMLRKKLELKSEALNVLSQELDQCRIQRDQFKLMAEQIQVRLSHMKKQSDENNHLKWYDTI